MSRVGNKPINIPDGVNVNLKGTELVVDGPKGKLNLTIDPEVKFSQEDKELTVNCDRNDKKYKALKGLYRMLVNNMVVGVSKGYEKRMEIIGTGYRAAVQGTKLVLNVGHSHPIDFSIPEGIKIAVEENTKLVINGIDKQLVGQVAADIRKFRPPEPYKGKGIKYSDEVIKRKAGKAAK